jgi:hypothetical protein
MGSSMMVPVVYVTWFMAVVFTCLLGKLYHPLLANHLLPVVPASLIDCMGAVCMMLCGHLLHGSHVWRPDKQHLPPAYCIMSPCLAHGVIAKIAQVHQQW